LLGPASGLAKHFGNEVFEPRGRNPVVGLIDVRIRIEAGIYHYPVDQAVNDGRDVVNAA
jgi:hypothetical protein